jgi:hypothetical protein
VLMLNGGPAGDPELQRLTYDHVDAADYEADPRRYDLHAPEFAASDYDFVILSQTLKPSAICIRRWPRGATSGRQHQRSASSTHCPIILRRASPRSAWRACSHMLGSRS